mmetsp:Transcript_21350/g.22805  ORF Transcript_21350/g.22805 Transcript_21350/m.22805 type:complete len:612 (+) Transcript_21350:24-1859(+)
MVFRSRRKSKTASRDDDDDDGDGNIDVGPAQHHRASELIGPNSSALSLDGRSLIVPDYGDDEDMSSLGTSKYGGYRGEGGSTIGYIGDMRIIGKASPEKEALHLENDPTLHYGDYDLQTYDHSLKLGVDEKEVTNPSSFEEKENEEESKQSCCPLWVTEAPLWLKLVIIASTALLVGAVVLIVVGAKLSAENQISPSLEGKKNPTSTLSPTPPSSFNVTRSTETPFDSVAELMNLNKTMSTEELDDTVTSSPTKTTSSPTDTFPSFNPAEVTQPPTIAPISTNLSSTLPKETISAPITGGSSHIPSNATSTAIPTVVPTKPPTKYPTKYPTESPTESPTLSTVNFFVMGGRFDGESAVALSNGLKSLPTMDGNTVLFHLGDWNSPYSTSCVEDSFITNANIYNQSSVPVYFVPGDNEYNDCPNPTQALELWYEYLLDFETKFWPEPSWDITRQSPNYSENFAFLQRNVLFVGINLVGGIIHNQEEWDARHDADLLWIDTAATKYGGNYTTMVILAHADPDIEINQNFFTGFYPMVEGYDEKIIFMHRNLGVDTWNRESGFNGIPNLDVVAVEGSTWPPMQVQIDTISGNFTIEQSLWYNEYESTGSFTSAP